MTNQFMSRSINSFHNKLKNHPRYLDHKLNHRLDDLIQILLKFECDTFMAQQTKQVSILTINSFMCLILLFALKKGNEVTN